MSQTSVNTAFNPANDPRKFRTALSRYATGITVITAASPEGLIGITANSFASISLDPALVMWSPDKKSSRHDLFVGADAFAIHVLSADQRAICDGFVRSKHAFDGVEHHLNAHGVPIIDGCLSVFECTRFATHDAGDHTLVLGAVEKAQERSGEGLVFANGLFTTLRFEASAA
ncbi:MAG: flavin reductase family protein [Pseudomonadota bacterium]